MITDKEPLMFMSSQRFSKTVIWQKSAVNRLEISLYPLKQLTTCEFVHVQVLYDNNDENYNFPNFRQAPAGKHRNC